MNPNVFPIGWRWLNPVWWAWVWAEHGRRHEVRLSWLEASCILCRDDLDASDRKYWSGVLDWCAVDMDRWSVPYHIFKQPCGVCGRPSVASLTVDGRSNYRCRHHPFTSDDVASLIEPDERPNSAVA